jgi:hypothetical protein
MHHERDVEVRSHLKGHHTVLAERHHCMADRVELQCDELEMLDTPFNFGVILVRIAVGA